MLNNELWGNSLATDRSRHIQVIPTASWDIESQNGLVFAAE